MRRSRWDQYDIPNIPKPEGGETFGQRTYAAKVKDLTLLTALQILQEAVDAGLPPNAKVTFRRDYDASTSSLLDHILIQEEGT